ncbi:MAG: tetratricopeptide repeat protein, partial [Ketobacter sp.]|nr:tetratricopeptide repeat protein [Ketobacter sp.]
ALTSQNIGSVYRNLGQEEEAEASYRQALSFAIEGGHKARQAGALRRLGELALDQGEPRRALEHLRRASSGAPTLRRRPET